MKFIHIYLRSNIDQFDELSLDLVFYTAGENKLTI